MPPSPPQAGLLLGVMIGAADAIILATDFGRSQGPVAVPPFTWLVVIWTWATVGCLTGVVFSSPRLGWVRGVALAAAGPSLLLIGRFATPFKAAMRLSTMEVLAIWAGVSLVICAGFAFLRFEKAQSLWKYAAGAMLSMLLLAWFAADVRIGRKAVYAAKPGKHNVALIVLDTVRYDDAMAHMPALAEFSRTATSFDNAWSSAPWTVPAHFALFTGADPWSVPYTKVSEGFGYSGPRLAERFAQRDYETAAIFSNPLLNESAGFGRGFARLTVSLQSRVCRSAIGVMLAKSVVHGGPRMPLCSWLLAPDVSSRASSFIARAERPVVRRAELHGCARFRITCFPHAATRPFRKVARSHQQALLDLRPGRQIDPRIGPRTRVLYQQAMRCMDRSLGTLLRKLDDGNTVIAIVGDHGEQFGEHGWGGHGNTLYRQVLHVPLILKIPGRAPERVTDAVSTTDLYRRLHHRGRTHRRVSPIALLDASRRRPVLSGFDARWRRSADGGFSVVQDELHFIRSLPGRETLYDYRADPAELAPLPAQKFGEAVDPLRQMLLRAARQQKRRVEFDALGYLN